MEKTNDKQDIFLFEEEFPVENVVNREKPADIDDEKDNKEEEIQSLYISKKDLSSILETNPDLIIQKKDASGDFIELLAKNLSKRKLLENEDDFIEIAIPVNKKNIEDDEDNYAYDDEDEEQYYFDEETGDYHQISKEELAEVDRKKKLRDKLTALSEKFEEKKYQLDPDTVRVQQLKEGFSDYINVPKVSGNKQRNYSDRYIPSDSIKEDVSKIEFADLELNVRNKEMKKTSILINRNEKSEIESIEVLCRCNEKTIIKFDVGEDDIDEVSKFTDKTVLVVDTILDNETEKELKEESDEENYDTY
ncbi:MAG: hypothetical protein GX372_01820 [Ignavibacteria bacterium]|jgi:hypothetical protein|nr:hypothetical protein [Ignavibacteria bacterium]